jgi:hypothetical protein
MQTLLVATKWLDDICVLTRLGLVQHCSYEDYGLCTYPSTKRGVNGEETKIQVRGLSLCIYVLSFFILYFSAVAFRLFTLSPICVNTTA